MRYHHIVPGIAKVLAWRGLGWWEGPLARLARRKRLAILVAFLSPLLLRAMLLPFFPVLAPRIHDEFSHLLAADTFAHARLANPRHPFWVHFESMHILTTPVYATVFPIGQGVVLAAGQVLFGHPWMGAWLGAGLMSGAICWMLQGWLPPRWALLGAALALSKFTVSSYWMNSYWGGCVAAAGGALVLGALPRLMRRPDWRYAAVMGVGLAVLANTRPFEGGVLGLIVAVPLVTWMLGPRGPGLGISLREVVCPLAVVLALMAAGMAYYFARVTGSAWLPPYVLYRTTMTMAPHFIWQKPRPEPLYNNREIRNFYVFSEMNDYSNARRSPFSELYEKAAVYWRFYFGPLLTIPLLALWKEPRARPVLLMIGAFCFALVGQVWHNVHYAAPATGLAILLVVQGMRRLRLWTWRGKPWGLFLVRCLPLLCALAMLTRPPGRDWPTPSGAARAGVLRELESSPDRHLVFVRYNPSHDTGNEWVYNGADIDASRVVWARELDAASDAKLMHYFKGRRTWLVEPDVQQPRLVPYRDAPFRPMPFVQLGAPGIEALRNPEEIKRKVLEKAPSHGNTRYTCDQWNFVFTAATGIAAADVTSECYGGNRAHPVNFEQWFAWLRRQR